MDLENYDQTLEPELFLEAARTGSLKLIKRLLAQGASPKVADEDRNTPLQIAAAQGNIPLVSFGFLR